MTAVASDIVSDAMTIIGEVAGSGVQQFSEDRILADVLRSFNLLFKKRFWEPYCEWTTHTLDGTLGIVNANAFGQVKDFEDFSAVHRDGQSSPLPVLPRTVNPNTIGTGTQVLCWTSLRHNNVNYDERKLQFWPKASVSIINVNARYYPFNKTDLPFTDNSVLYLDSDMLSYGAAFMTLSSDDLNAQAAQTAQGLMDMRYNDITAGLSAHPLPINGGGGDIPTQWFVPL